MSEGYLFRCGIQIDTRVHTRKQVCCLQEPRPRGPDWTRAAYAVLAPLQVEGTTCSTAGLSFDEDESRLRLTVGVADREKLPFAVVCEILLEVGFTSEITSRDY